MKHMVHAGSSNLHSSTYDPDKRELTVTFKGKDGNPGDSWKYPVPPHIAEGLHSTEPGFSAGKYFHAQIKTRFQGVKV